MPLIKLNYLVTEVACDKGQMLTLFNTRLVRFRLISLQHHGQRQSSQRNKQQSHAGFKQPAVI